MEHLSDCSTNNAPAMACSACDCAIEIATEEVYLKWFYNTTNAIFFHDDKFEEKMADRFYRATGKVAPNNIGF